MWAPYLLRDGRIEEEGSGRSRARGRGGIGGRAGALHKEGDIKPLAGQAGTLTAVKAENCMLFQTMPFGFLHPLKKYMWHVCMVYNIIYIIYTLYIPLPKLRAHTRGPWV